MPRPLVSLSVALFLCGTAAAQAAKPTARAAKPRPSRADQLVRHRLERSSLNPPSAVSGQDIGIGQGKLALVVRRSDGRLEVTALPRGDGGATQVTAPEFWAKELGKQIEEDAEKLWPKAGKVGAKKVGAKKAGEKSGEKAVAKKAGAKNTDPDEFESLIPLLIHWRDEGRSRTAKGEAATRTLDLRVARTGDEVRVGIGGTGEPVVGKRVDRAALARLLLRHPRGAMASSFTVSPTAQARLQDILTTWEVLRSAGLKPIRFQATLPANKEEDTDAIASLPEQLGWQKTKARFPRYDDELVFLVSGDVPWSRLQPLIMRCAAVGIWQIGFVAQDPDGRRRWKITTHLPVDG